MYEENRILTPSFLSPLRIMQGIDPMGKHWGYMEREK